MEIDAIYENGVLRPLEPLGLEENQCVRISISDNGEQFGELFDTEYMAQCAREAGDAPGIEEVRRRLSKIPGSLEADFRTERDER